jgi:hypothetical protein
MGSMSGKKISDIEIEEQLLADADNPDAWEASITVQPSYSARPEWYGQTKHLELAAKFYVLSVLHRLGAEASLTHAQPDNVDIAAVRQSGEAFTIDVKTLLGTSQWLIERFKARKHHFMVFVCFERDWREPHLNPEIFIWSSESLSDFITSEKATTVSLDVVASKLDAMSAWEEFSAQSRA